MKRNKLTKIISSVFTKCKKIKKKKIIIGISGIIIVSSIGIGIYVFNQNNKPSTTEGKTITQKVQKGNLQVGSSADGRISLSQTNLNFQVSGQVKKINVKVGDDVKAGDVLSELDSTDLELAVTSATNALNTAKSNYNNAINQKNIDVASEKIKIDEAKAKLDSNPNDSSANDNYQLEVKKYNNLLNNNSSVQNSKNSINDAQTKLDQANENLSKIYLKAPCDGKVMTINHNVGEVVSGVSNTSSNNSNNSSSFITLCDPNSINITTNITEGDVSGIAKDQTVSVSVDAISAEHLSGKVVSVSNVASVDSSGIVTYQVISKLDNPNDAIKDGMSCFATFLKKEDKDVLLIPNKAIFMEDNKQYVNLQLEDKTVQKIAVTCGLSNGVQTEVTDGVKEGDTLLIGGVQK